MRNDDFLSIFNDRRAGRTLFDQTAPAPLNRCHGCSFTRYFIFRFVFVVDIIQTDHKVFMRTQSFSGF